MHPQIITHIIDMNITNIITEKDDKREKSLAESNSVIYNSSVSRV